jgi:hypothetical protein
MKVWNTLLQFLRDLGDFLGKIVTTIILSLVYFFGIGPLSILGFIVRKDFIGSRKRETNSYWIKPKHLEPTLNNLKKPY